MSNLNIKEMRSIKERLEAISEEIEAIRKGADLDIEEENHVRSIEIAMNGASLASEYLGFVIIDLATEPTEALIDTYKPEGATE